MTLKSDKNELAHKVIDQMFDNHSLRQSLSIVGLDTETFYKCLKSDLALHERYAQARTATADMEAEIVVDIAKDENIDPQRARNINDAIRWKASKYNPKVYGEKLDLNVTNTVDIAGALAESRLRALPARYLNESIDTQHTVINDQSDTKQTGLDSVEPKNVPMPKKEDSPFD